MNIWEIVVIAIGLSMDAFAVSICKGLASGKATNKQALSAGVWFGGFQALMPTIGYLLGSNFKDAITAVDHWIAFILLGWIGIGMIRSAREEEEADADFSWKSMLPMAVATSIDALAAGVMFSFTNAALAPTVISIGLITFTFGFVGVKMGSVLGTKFQKGAQISGGTILIIMGFKILLEHLGIL